MLKNYFKVAWRNLTGNKFFSFINIGGLAIGMTVVMLIALWIWDELSYDQQNKHYDRVAQVMRQTTINGETGTGFPSPIPLAEELRKNYKNDFSHVVLSWWNREHILSFEDHKFTRIGKFMEPDAPEVLSLNMLKGDWGALKDPSAILLSSSAARAIFGDKDPMDKTMRIDNKMAVKVTGVYDDIPDNSKFRNVAFIASWDMLAASDDLVKAVRTNWGFDAAEIYVQLAANADLDKVSAKIRRVEFDRIKDSKELVAYKPMALLQPMRKWHLYAEWKNGVNTGGAIQYVWLFGAIALFVLLLACINFMNITTARSEKRAKEIGIRKAIGSLRRQLISQFFAESLAVVLLSFGISLLLMQATLPFFNEIADKKMSIPWTSALFWITGILFCLFTGLVAGSYPAFFLSSFKPVKVLKGSFKTGKLTALPRKILVVLQFATSIILIICTIVVFEQIQFARNRPIGYKTDGLLQLQMNSPEFFGHEQALRNDLIKSGVVVEMAESSSPPTGVWSSRSGFDWKGKSPGLQTEFGAIAVTKEYGKTVGWQLKAGRDFSADFASDSSSLIINEAAAAFMNLKSPVGENIKWNEENYKVIGVVKNMVVESPYERPGPIVYTLKNEKLNFILLKLNPAMRAHEALEKIRVFFENYSPSSPFDYKFVDDNFAKKFAAEERIGKLATFFSALAIFISSLGLFGMALFMAEQRRKEIGLRKVLGASVFDLWKLLSKDFVILVFISFLIAIPIAWPTMHNWLHHYEYRTSISLWVFVLTCLAALFIAIGTVSFQAIKAAMANPAKGLRAE